MYRRHAGLGRLGCRGPLPRPEALRAIADWTTSHKAFWEGSLDRLEAAMMLDGEEDGDG